MKLTNEQIEQILDGAPDGATHYENEYKYLKAARSGYMVFDTDGGDWDYEYTGICETHSLTDLSEILSLRQRVQELERDNKSLTFKVELIKHKVDIDARKEVLLSIIGRPSTTILAERDVEVARKAFIAGATDAVAYISQQINLGYSSVDLDVGAAANEYAQRIKDGEQ